MSGSCLAHRHLIALSATRALVPDSQNSEHDTHTRQRLSLPTCSSLHGLLLLCSHRLSIWQDVWEGFAQH